MPEIMLTKNQELEWSEEDKDRMRELLFSRIDGFKEADQKNWRKFWNMLMHATVGEIFSIEIWFPRNSKFHRLHMAMESRVFKNQERFPTFQVFRDWMKIGMKFCDYYPGPHGGGVVAIPRSISFRKLDEDGMRKFHEDWLAFLRTDHAAKVLWPHAPDLTRAEMVDFLLEDFMEDHA